MKRLSVTSLFVLLSGIFCSFARGAQADYCQRYQEQDIAQQAILAVAKATGYARSELCTLATLRDILVQPVVRYDEEHLPIDHLNVTLYYETYACQYFVRNDDQAITGKNCYNTW